MSDAPQHVIAAVDELGVWPRGTFQIHKRLGDGPTNETWLVSHARERYVLRLIKPLAATMTLSLQQELHIVKAAGRYNLAAPIVAACTRRGFVLSRYLQGTTWTANDMQDQKQLGRLALTLHRLHGLECEARPFNLPAVVNNYAQLSRDPHADTWVENILSELEAIASRTPVVCHNDVTAANVIDDGQLHLIDWEFAALGDPLFDLAVVVAHYELDAKTTQYFLDAYPGGSDANAYADLIRWCEVYKNLLALWSSVLEAESSAPGNGA